MHVIAGITMRAEIPYNGSTLVAELPERTFVTRNEAFAKLDPVPDLDVAMRDALDHPIDSPPIRALVKPGSRVTIAFDDATVGMFGPVRGAAIKAALRELDAAGVERKNIQLICANSLHRKQRPHELAFLIGADLMKEFEGRVTNHDAEDPSGIVDFGKCPEGYEVEVNRAVAESDLTIYVNASHNRGFSGGWKSICVGLSTYKSIRRHHTPDGMSMSVRQNVMHDMLDAMGRHLEASIPGKIFKIDTLPANPFQAGRVFAGSVGGTRAAVLDALEGLYPARRDLSGEKYDVVLYGVPNWSPYAIFASMNPLLTLVSSGLGYLGGTVAALGKKGCTVIMVTPCHNAWDGVHHPSYRDVWDNVLPLTRDPWEIHHRFAEQYAHDERYIKMYRDEFAFHPVHAIMAAYPLRRLAHAGRVIVAGAEAPSLPAHLGFGNAATIEQALGMAEDIHGPGYSLAWVRQPTVPSKPIL